MIILTYLPSAYVTYSSTGAFLGISTRDAHPTAATTAAIINVTENDPVAVRIAAVVSGATTRKIAVPRVAYP